MAKREEHRPILANGEHYIAAVSKKGGFGKAVYPRSYEEARTLLLKDIAITKESLDSLEKEKRVEEVVFCLRLNEKFIAKSYNPARFMDGANLRQVGSRRWIKNQTQNIVGKSVFVRTMPDHLKDVAALLDRAEGAVSKEWKNDIRKIDNISLLTESEQLLGFEDWVGGAVEIVLHPMGSHSEKSLALLTSQLKKSGVSANRIKTATYPGGLTFACAELNEDTLNVLRRFNPLRTAHPFKFRGIPELRGSLLPDAPTLGSSAQISRIKVGQFDGGADISVPLLQKLTKNYDLVATAPDAKCVEHGTAVAGAILHGPLNPYGKGAALPQPLVSVESFRVLPLKDPSDINLYEVIDKIEEIVPQRNDIHVYNISLGPEGPVLDDEISRFTYALDTLAYAHKVLFVVACGNDGEAPVPFNRVQSPADCMNGLGVGASTFQAKAHGRFEPIHASYSCIGPGREGSKIKPDLSAYGGCGSYPFHLAATSHGKKVAAAGTSFSAPLVSRLAGEIIGRSDRINPLMAKVLLIHTAEPPSKGPDHHFGYGLIEESAENVLSCSPKKVTTLFQGSMRSGSFAKLPIPFINCEDKVGKYQINWTIGIWTKPDSLNPDEYSTTCIEDVFYPHSRVYSFSAPKKGYTGKKKFEVLDLDEDKQRAQQLVAAGWKQAQYPKSASGNIHKPESDLRQHDMKWDTLVKRSKSGLLSKVCDPFLILHSMGRNDHEPDSDPLHYAVAVTIEVKSYAGDLYNDICARFDALIPIEVRAVNELFVRA